MDFFAIYQSILQGKIPVGIADDLDKIIAEYPYFSLPRMLKALIHAKNENIFEASAYSVNRRQLKQMLEGKIFFSDIPASMDMDASEIIIPELAPPGPEHDLFSIVDMGSLPFRRPPFNLPFSVSESTVSDKLDAFIDWDIKVRTLKYKDSAARVKGNLHIPAPEMEVKEEIKQEEPRPVFSRKVASQNLIDAFLENQGHIRRKNADKEAAQPVKSAVESIMEDENLVTETMARLHLLQNNRREAIRIYEKLGLLYPEKSTYFADQINKIKDE